MAENKAKYGCGGQATQVSTPKARRVFSLRTENVLQAVENKLVIYELGAIIFS